MINTDTFSHGRQLVLPVGITSEASFENFFGTTNQRCVPPLSRFAMGEGESFVFLTGAPDSGKSHLASAVLNKAEAQGFNVGYLAMGEFPDIDDVIFRFFGDLEAIDVLILEDVEQWLSNGSREQMLFNLFNQFKQDSRRLLLTSRVAPSALNIALPDLSSRLKSGLLLRLQSMDDFEKQAVLRQVAESRGMRLTEEVTSFIIRRSPRNMGELLAVLDSLERYSLVEKRLITIPFVKKVIGH